MKMLKLVGANCILQPFFSILLKISGEFTIVNSMALAVIVGVGISLFLSEDEEVH